MKTNDEILHYGAPSLTTRCSLVVAYRFARMTSSSIPTESTTMNVSTSMDIKHNGVMATFAYLAIGLLAVLFAYFAIGIMSASASAQAGDFKKLGDAVEQVRAKHKLPAMGAVLVTSEGVQAIGVSGTRKRGGATLATTDDLWHLGSDGKAMTATMIARLVERGTMKWEQTLGETFPDLAPQMKADMKSVTLTQLLSHRAGFGANFDAMKYVGRKDLVAARLDVLREAMAGGLKSKPGSAHLYSNWGYAVAGAMAERAAGKSFEVLMREELFAPLKMTSVGFGGTGTVGKIDQPWPHDGQGKPMPSNGPEMDNLPVMSPAGTMHMSLADWSRFVAEHIRGAQGKSSVLKKETFAKLHAVVGNDYALGWIVAQRDWAGGNALSHAGDNTMNSALVWVAPAKDFAVLITVNQSDAFVAADELAGTMILSWVKK
jgi:CubicO group peptidase (beta-lactamase class C family)